MVAVHVEAVMTREELLDTVASVSLA